MQQLDIHGIHVAEFDHVPVDPTGERQSLVNNVRHPVRHARPEVPPGAAEHDDDAAGHVLAAMVARAFDDRHRAGVPHRESVARLASGEQLPARGAVQDRIAEDEMLVRGVSVRGPAEGTNGDLPAAQALADVIVGLALEIELHPATE